MEFKEPLLGIMKIYDYPQSKAYEVRCTCGNPDHLLHTLVEVEDDTVIVNTYVTVNSDYWSEWLTLDMSKLIDNYALYSAVYAGLGFVNYIARNLQKTYDIWVKGCIKLENTTIMSQEQAIHYADTIKHAISEMEKNK